MTETTNAPIPVETPPERVAAAVSMLRRHLANLTGLDDRINPSGDLCPSFTASQAKINYDHASSRERRRLYSQLLDLYYGHLEIFQASNVATLSAFDIALSCLEPAEEPAEPTPPVANDAALAPVAAE